VNFGLEGEANDYFGKGHFGGTNCLSVQIRDFRKQKNNIILVSVASKELLEKL